MSLVRRLVDAAVFSGGVGAPVGVEVTVVDQYAELQDGFGAGESPAGSGDVEPVGDQMTTGASMTSVAMGRPAASACS